jgi:hypothetical protein
MCFVLDFAFQIFHLIVMIGFVASYGRQLQAIYNVYAANPPQVGRPALDIRPFCEFLKNYMRDMSLNVLSCIAVIM